MKRAPIVITATVAGLAGVLEFHSRPASLSVATIPAAGSSPARQRVHSPDGDDARSEGSAQCRAPG